MATELIDLTIEEGSLVDEPANPLAKIVLFKRNTTEARESLEKGSPMTFDEMVASLSPEQKAALEEYLAQMKAADEKPAEEPAPAEQQKSAEPSEELTKRDAVIAELTKALADETDKRLVREYAEKAATYDSLPQRELVAKALRAIDEKLPEMAADFGAFLASVNEVAKRGGASLFQPIGKSTTPAGSAAARLESAIAEVRKANPRLSYEQAYDRALTPELRAQLVTEERA